MATYDEWNDALRAYFVAGVPQGSPVYLSVDEEALVSAGRLLSATEPHAVEPAEGGFVQDFCRAVRQRVVDANGRVLLGAIRGHDGNGSPRALAFLSATVLAASRMADEGDVSEINYFTRLHGVLGLSQNPGRTRPPGMEFGASAEEPLWKEWNLWLQENGILPSARPGDSLPKRYINYPLSQALLRRADKDKLRELFRYQRWTSDWDAETVLGRVRHEAGHLTQHLQQVLASGGQRLRALAEAIYEEHASWREAPHLSATAAVHRESASSTILMAGLYRTENPISGQVDYYLYPRQRRGQQAEGRGVTLERAVHQLAPDRPGWLLPIGPLGVATLDDGLRLPIEPPGETYTLVLPQRSFWVLVPDPENADSGVYASWEAPSLGTPFLLLCRRHILSDLTRLRDERLIEWSGEPVPAFSGEEWVEVRHCMVVSESWQGVFPQDRDLYEALRPTQSLAIGLAGGLRVSGVRGWLDGHGPEIAVYGFHREADVRVVRASDGLVLLDEPRTTSTPFALTWPAAGDYSIHATCGDETALRLVKIVAWDELQVAPIEQPEGTVVAGRRISGATIATIMPEERLS